MSSEKNHSNTSETEYQFGKEDAASEAGSGRRAPSLGAIIEKLKEKLPKKKKGKVLLFIGIALYIAYKFFSTTGPSAPVSPSHSAANAEKKLSQPLNKSEATVSEKPKAEPVVSKPAPVKTVEVQEPKKDIFAAEKPPEKAKETVSTAISEEMTAKIKALDQNISLMNSAVQNLQSSLLTLSSSAVVLSKKVNTLEGFQQAEIRSFQKSAAQYYVQSLVTGRAWLHASSGGDLITVKVGDTIPGYGEVSGINVDAGVVTTTSGRKIGYGPNDQ